MARGSIVVHGTAALGTGASMRGGTIVVRGNCGPRSGAGMKGGTLIVEGYVGYLAGFMTHAGDLIVLRRRRRGAGRLAVGRAHLGRRRRSAALGADAMVHRARPTRSWRRVHGLLRAKGIDGDVRRSSTSMAEQKLWYFNKRNPEAWLKI